MLRAMLASPLTSPHRSDSLGSSHPPADAAEASAVGGQQPRRQQPPPGKRRRRLEDIAATEHAPATSRVTAQPSGTDLVSRSHAERA